MSAEVLPLAIQDREVANGNLSRVEFVVDDTAAPGDLVGALAELLIDLAEQGPMAGRT